MNTESSLETSNSLIERWLRSQAEDSIVMMQRSQVQADQAPENYFKGRDIR